MRYRWVKALLFALAGVAALYLALESSASESFQSVVAQKSSCAMTELQ